MTTPIYALEELPNLIGDRQYRMLCMALGWPANEANPTGQEFAHGVQSHVYANHGITTLQRAPITSEELSAFPSEAAE